MRYEVRVINSNGSENCTGISACGKLLLETDSADAAKAHAEQEGSAYYYGTAIVDNQERTIDWGNDVTDFDQQPVAEERE